MQCHREFDLSEMQNKLYDMFVAFHNVCEQHNIKYYMVDGTMLGAVRHQDFIPWDDDIDVGMYRKDFDKLISLPQSAWPEMYSMLDSSTYEGYPYLFAKLVDRTTTIIEDSNSEIVLGVSIDVFPLDGVGNSWFGVMLRNSLVFALVVCLGLSQVRIAKRRPIWKRILLYAVQIIDPIAWKGLVVRFLPRQSSEASQYIGNLVGAWGLREIMERSCFGQPRLYKFREGYFFGVEKPHEYLTSLYGDYMQLPPVEKRISHHRFRYVNLHLPYAEYLRLRDDHE